MALLRGLSKRNHASVRVTKPRARTDDLVIEELDGEVLVYDAKDHKAHCLASAAAKVWRACDGTKDVPALAESLSLSVDDVTRALEMLDEVDLLENQGLQIVTNGDGNGNGNGNGNGLTRRELGRKSAMVGAAAAAAPMLYSIAVPSPAAAATPTNQACALFSVDSCGVSSGAGAIAGCCCCCQGGGNCKVGGAVSTCTSSSCPFDKAPHCSSSCNPGINCTGSVNAAGCCGVAGSSSCGCAFAGPPGSATNAGCLCGQASGSCNKNTSAGCTAGCTPGAANCGAGCCSTTGCTSVVVPGGHVLINCPGCTPGAGNCVPCCNGSPISQTSAPFNCCTPGGATSCPQQVFP